MTNLFFYGTLRDEALLRIVLGRDADLSRAALAGHEVLEIPSQPFPLIAASEGASSGQGAAPEPAAGLLLRDVSEEDLARLDFYEGGFAYETRELTVSTPDGPLPALVYFPPNTSPDKGFATGGAWSFEDWQGTWGEVSRIAAREVMDRYGQTHGETTQTLLPFIRNRAWSQVLAQKPAPQALRSSMSMAQDVELQEMLPGYDGFFRFRPFRLRYRQFDGTWSETLRRECFVAYDVALVLPYDPVSDKILLTEQMRFGPVHRGDPAPWVLEPVAGMIDASESPEAAARREAVEEAKLHLSGLVPVAKGYASPGYSTEFYHSFIGLCDLSDHGAQVMGGLDEEHEDIRNHILLFQEAMTLIETGEVNAVPLQMLLFGLAARRDGLRTAAGA